MAKRKQAEKRTEYQNHMDSWESKAEKKARMPQSSAKAEADYSNHKKFAKFKGEN